MTTKDTLVQVEKPKAILATRGDKWVKDLELRMLQSSVAIVDDLALAREIEPEQKEPPAEWVESLGAEEANQRFRIAQAGWLPESRLPAFISIAARMAASIMKGRAETTATENVGMAFIVRSESHPYPESEVSVLPSDS